MILEDNLFLNSSDDISAIISEIMGLLFAGSDTTTNLIGSLLYCLATYPEEFEKLKADHGLIPAAIEETLRMFPPFPLIERRCTAAFELKSGRKIEKNQIMVCHLQLGNRDEKIFASPNRFDLSRKNARLHLAFSHGIHTCVGRELARMEARLVLKHLLKRFSSIQIKKGTVPRWRSSLTFNGLSECYLVFE